ncbi:MAG TPA: hypothetical protein VEM96_15565 [Pyrinomonadaceae bacterium]|nr:hypothetical protein [Pyrinomonadaceae bacterium]
MKVGDIISWERTFSADDIRLFNKVSGDQGVHHVTPDEQGRLMVNGLLTATVPRDWYTPKACHNSAQGKHPG